MSGDKIILNFHASNTESRGPGMVFQNLMRGLVLLQRDDFEIRVNDHSDVCFSRSTINVVLQSTPFAKSNVSRFCAESLGCYVGPNVFVLPEEWREELKPVFNIIVPSDWVSNLYKLRGLSNKKVDVWSVGIDTEAWTPNKPREEKDPTNCLVYYKNRSREQLDAILSLLNDRGCKPTVIEYGSYVPAELFVACNNASFCVNLSNTESQGVALMEILSMNVPVFVFDQTQWTAPDGKQVRATSVPYFSQECGIVSRGVKAELLQFLSEYEKYNPRNYILEKHTLVQSANRFLEIVGL